MNQTQTGPPLVRRAGEPDTDELARMLTGLTELSRYFRFQTAIGSPPRSALLLRMLCPAGAAFVATRGPAIVGHAMWAWAPGEATAELAAVIAEDDQRRGLGIRMLSIAAADAIAAGATHFLFVVSAANERSLRMVRRRWPDATVDRDGALLSFVAPARLPDQPEERADVVHEQTGCLECGEVPAAGELRPMDDSVPAV
ncbi:ribosomal protein S18 acetylase RimI-like enzyme [Kribbella aluminosa]|uniref:Ribosomal protein S18 acetylase RimI-like enzyme n=1 Tax=Kribbella aluminosa TaxID=416017 RepID=A0ABS4UUM6_9ACTN|nr:ribosomal protein S18 acetylase RimI-like enzyme [Kribbella aluminosa]